MVGVPHGPSVALAASPTLINSWLFCGSWVVVTDAVTTGAGLLTVNIAVDVLLAVLLSLGEVAPTVAVLLTTVLLGTLQLTVATTVKVACSPLAMLPLVQVIVPLLPAAIVLHVHPAGFV